MQEQMISQNEFPTRSEIDSLRMKLAPMVEAARNQEKFLRDRRFITIQDIAEILGATTPTVRRWVKCDQVPMTKVGNSWIIRTSDYEEWLETKREPSNSAL